MIHLALGKIIEALKGVAVDVGALPEDWKPLDSRLQVAEDRRWRASAEPSLTVDVTIGVINGKDVRP